MRRKKGKQRNKDTMADTQDREDKNVIEEDKNVKEEYERVIEENKHVIEEDKLVKEEDKHVIEEDKHVQEDDTHVMNLKYPRPCQVYYNLGAELTDEDEPENESQGTFYYREQSVNRIDPDDAPRKEEIWNRGSVPPDLVASAERFRVIKEEPRKEKSNQLQVQGYPAQ